MRWVYCSCMFVRLSLLYSAREEPKFKVVPAAQEDIYMAEDMYSKDAPKAPYFTQQPSNQGVKEGHPVRFECTLLPIGDPNMSVEWYCNGNLVTVGMLYPSVLIFALSRSSTKFILFPSCKQIFVIWKWFMKIWCSNTVLLYFASQEILWLWASVASIMWNYNILTCNKS